MRNANLQECTQGVRIGGKMVNNLRYADDKTLIAGSEDELKQLLKKVKEASANEGLLLNIKKTKIIMTSHITKLKLENDSIEVVEEFPFLGSTICKNGSSIKDVTKWLALGRAAMTKLTKIMQDKDISKHTKKRLVSTIVFPVAMYGSECWTLRKKEKKKIEAFEM